ncbi:MAG TPA: hypothetical protein VK302_12340 [Terriglobales bacterium]|nr:hypothetical protein [Terriglobales bacterium]
MKKMRYRSALLALSITTLSLVASAQDWRTKQFAAPADDVYKSAVRVIALHHEIESKYPENRVVRFHVGTTAWSWGYNVGLRVDPQPNGTSLVKVAIEKSGGPVFSWGSGQKEILKIFRWMGDDLAASKPAEPVPAR